MNIEYARALDAIGMLTKMELPTLPRQYSQLVFPLEKQIYAILGAHFESFTEEERKEIARRMIAMHERQYAHCRRMEKRIKRDTIVALVSGATLAVIAYLVATTLL